MATLYLKDRPPSDDVQHLPFILFANTGVKSDDSAMLEIASDMTTAIVLMAELPVLFDRAGRMPQPPV
jgi:hypothetical protein